MCDQRRPYSLSSEMCHFLQMLSQLYRFWFTSSKQNLKNTGAVESTNKIIVMEKRISQLEEENKELQQQLEYNRNKEIALQKVLVNYDNLLKKVIMEKKDKPPQQDETTLHLINLESAFYDLLQKYERAKLVVQGFQQNEAVLKKQVEEYEDILDSLRLKFCKYKSYSEKSLRLKNDCAKHANSFDEMQGKKRRLLTTI